MIGLAVQERRPLPAWQLHVRSGLHGAVLRKSRAHEGGRRHEHGQGRQLRHGPVLNGIKRSKLETAAQNRTVGDVKQ